jgi:uncharacterized protein (DUF427 family)
VTLAMGRGPLSPEPAGSFSEPVPHGVAYIEPFTRRLRGMLDGRTVVDSERVVVVHRPGQRLIYAIPAGDVDGAAAGKAEPAPHVDGHLTIPWGALDEWYQEEQRIVGYPANPYHRVDCIPTRRHLRVEVAGTVLVDTTETLGVYETALVTRLYVPRSAVRTDLLRPSATTSYCPYKGHATWWSAVVDGTVVEDVAWSYEDTHPESSPLRGLLSFDEQRADVVTDLPEERSCAPSPS